MRGQVEYVSQNIFVAAMTRRTPAVRTSSSLHCYAFLHYVLSSSASRNSHAFGVVFVLMQRCREFWRKGLRANRVDPLSIHEHLRYKLAGRVTAIAAWRYAHAL